MKNIWFRAGVCAVAMLWVAGTLASASAREMSVQVRDGQLRSRPSFLGAVVTGVTYGERVEAGAEQAGWREVTTATGKTGWLHESALSARQLDWSAAAGGDVRTGASGEEVALAGKGFSREVEAAYKQQNGALNYAGVDRLEKIRVSDAEAARFLSEGGLAQ